MIRSRNEHTLAQTCEVAGRGYWSGQQTTVRISPASLGTGIQLMRTDLPDNPVVTVGLDVRHDHELRTVLKTGDTRFAMIEHLMAALYALEIDNCLVEIDAEELPGLDGSANAYVKALRASGLVIQAAPRRQLIIDQTVRVGTAASWIEVSPSFDGRAHYSYRLDYGDTSSIKPQTFQSVLTPDIFCREIAPARTFVTMDQADALRKAGLAGHVANQDLLVFGSDGPVDNVMRYPDECARHKVLDLIGDLALVGVELIGRVISHRGGHNLNAKLAERLQRMTNRRAAYDQRRAA